MPDFPDHFSAIAGAYARYRPTYPDALFGWLADVSPAHDAAWDCGCGNGQATVQLAARFAHVVGTDASASQIAEALPHPAITWRVVSAEQSGLDAASMDAVTVAQALHWFDLPRFWTEVRRVVRPNGLVAAWTYGVPYTTDGALTERLRHLHDVVVGPYWPIERGHVDQRYRTLDFPFRRIAVPRFDMRAAWTLDQAMGYLRSWSAVRRYVEANGVDPIDAFTREIAADWGAGVRDMIWPLTVLAGLID